MKQLRKLSALLLCLSAFLSSYLLEAQEQYTVEVRLGTISCTGDQSVNTGVGLSGTVEVRQGAPGSGVIQSFSNRQTGSLEAIFSGVFDGGLPTHLKFNTGIVGIDPGNGSCSRMFENVEIPINASQQTYSISSTEAGLYTSTLNLEVSIFQTGLLPGSLKEGQTVCPPSSPKTIKQLFPASGVTDFQYIWEYSETGSFPWTEVREDPTDPTSLLVDDPEYTPPFLTSDRWYRRLAVDLESGQIVATEPVLISVTEHLEERYRLDFYFRNYTCQAVPELLDLDIDLFVGDMPLTVADQVVGAPNALLSYEMSQRPESLTFEIDGTEPGIDVVGLCDKSFVGTQTLNGNLGQVVEYSVTSGNATFSYAVSVVSVGAPVIDGGEIGMPQVVCSSILSLDELTETREPEGDLTDIIYEWQLSTNAGRDWDRSIADTRNYQPPVPTEDTWYRRVIYLGCSRGTSNMVKIDVPTDILLSIVGLGDEYDAGDPSVTLTGIPAGGIFYGNGITNNTFDPTAAGAGEHTIEYQYNVGGVCTESVLQIVKVNANALCSSIVPRFDNRPLTLDAFSGQMVYEKSDDCAQDIPLGCITAQADGNKIPNVVATSAVTLSDEWDYSGYYQNAYQTSSEQANNFEKGAFGRWRVKSTYSYNTSEIVRDKNFNTGTYGATVFNWQFEQANQPEEWIHANEVTKYSPNGEALEELNAIGIASTVKMGYADALPYMIAQNSTYKAVFFESFELSDRLESGAQLDGGANINETAAHAGMQSLSLESNEGLTTPLMQLDTEGAMMVHSWIKGNANQVLQAQMLSESGTIVTDLSMDEIGRSGEWGLYHVVLPSTNHSSFKIRLQYTGTGTIWMDDVRIQPEYADTVCYVYDPTSLWLLTIFDAQHFGLFYQYDGEGKLVRKAVETERGLRTLQETFYNLPKVNK